MCWFTVGPFFTQYVWNVFPQMEDWIYVWSHTVGYTCIQSISVISTFCFTQCLCIANSWLEGFWHVGCGCELVTVVSFDQCWRVRFEQHSCIFTYQVLSHVSICNCSLSEVLLVYSNSMIVRVHRCIFRQCNWWYWLIREDDCGGPYVIPVMIRVKVHSPCMIRFAMYFSFCRFAQISAVGSGRISSLQFSNVLMGRCIAVTIDCVSDVARGGAGPISEP